MCIFIFIHRVTSGTYVKKNAMPASNLAIVFGPTLLRTRFVHIKITVCGVGLITLFMGLSGVKDL